MPQAQDRLFRSAAVARLSSPEGLDTLMVITTVRGWIALAGLASVITGGLIWGVRGTVPQVVTGQGIMVRQGGISRIQAPGSGQIDSIYLEQGSAIKKGQTIAVLAQPELRTSIQQLEATIAELKSNRGSTAALFESNRKLELASVAQQEQQSDEAIKAAQSMLTYLDSRIAAEKRALDGGLMTPDAAQETIALKAETQLKLLGEQSKKKELAGRGGQLQVESNRTLFSLDQTIRSQENRLVQLKDQLTSTAHVVSLYDGVVVEKLADVGQSIGAGAPIGTVESATQPIQVMMFIPLEGKRIQPGMRVEMVPGGVKPEETGYFLGTVVHVSPAPLSGSALDLHLKNQLLVEQFTQQGGAYLVDVVVENDSSGVGKLNPYKWTSRSGAPISFGSGTLLTGRIVVASTRPLALVIPAIRRWLGG